MNSGLIDNLTTAEAVILALKEDDLEAAIVALANRCKQSKSPILNEWGAQQMDFINSLDTKSTQESGALPVAVNS